jgi:hypothetical protein
MFYREIFDSPAFKDLSPYAQAAYLHFRAKYRQFNKEVGSKDKRQKVKVGNAEDISLTYAEMARHMSKGKYAKVQGELWEHGFIEYVRHGGPGKICNIFRIDGYNEKGELIRLPWAEWKKNDPEFAKKLKGGPSRIDRSKYKGYGFEKQWEENPEKMHKAVINGIRKRQREKKSDCLNVGDQPSPPT